MKRKEHTKNSPLSSRKLGIALIASLAGLAGGTANAAVAANGNGQLSTTSDAAPAESHDSLAKKLANPMAAMISVPFQNNFDFGMGPGGDGTQWKMNIQPVIPMALNDDWNLITRVILPVVSQHDIAGTKGNKSGNQSGLGDTVASFWFSPSKPTAGGLIWGVGPAFSIPTGSDIGLLGSNQWAAGPTAVMLKTTGKFTYGGLVNHLWTVAGSGGMPSDISNTFMQPFISYLPGDGVTFALNSESSYNWESDQWTIPFNLTMKKMFKIGSTPAQWELGGRYYAQSPHNGPEWGIRASLTFLFPKS
jgi:hypothetical protein